MYSTTNIVQRSLRSRWRAHGYLFRPAAIVTIAIGLSMHIYRVIFGDELAARYVITPMVDKILLVPMCYAAVAGIIVWQRVWFGNERLKVPFTVSLIYICASVPLHVYVSYVKNNTALLLWFPMWFSYLLICVVYPTFFLLFWKVRYRE